ncbi:hypothetical protein NPIL_289251 [Nephila pilipes]|uniref:Uncharacterized protein n=1 Tax=Nephila pilipes TaxID=299642 RepID=A0A8X6QID4_NEPPI|nr:hypothetical protein NPIL_289251 [Nephila pilipes]
MKSKKKKKTRVTCKPLWTRRAANDHHLFIFCHHSPWGNKLLGGNPFTSEFIRPVLFELVQKEQTCPSRKIWDIHCRIEANGLLLCSHKWEIAREIGLDFHFRGPLYFTLIIHYAGKGERMFVWRRILLRFAGSL